MKLETSFLIKSPKIWDKDVFHRILKEFLGLVSLYFFLNLFVSWKQSNSMPEASLLLEEEFQRGLISFPIYILSTFPFGSLSSIVLIAIYLVWSTTNKKLCLWLLSEKSSEVKKILTIELLSFSVILIYLNLLLVIGIFKYVAIDLNPFVLLLVLSIWILTILGLIILNAYRYIEYSYHWLEQPKGRAFLVWLVPLLTIFLLVWGIGK
jgi:hypothetical protein